MLYQYSIALSCKGFYNAIVMFSLVVEELALTLQLLCVQFRPLCLNCVLDELYIQMGAKIN